MTKTKIDWCDYSWNPVWGCLNNCSYCYAHKIARRFGDPEFKPTWKQKNFDKSFPKKPSRIFVNSMSDVAFWQAKWRLKILNKICEYPKHTFLILTKIPECLELFTTLITPNLWLGITITTWQEALDRFPGYMKKRFVSVEPMLTHIDPSYLRPYQWVIIGSETGNRKDKIVPRRDWIIEIVDYCRAVKIPIFLKDSLRGIWGEELIQEFPEKA